MDPKPTDDPSKRDLSYCTVKTGVNDLLDYISIAVALVIPLVLGPCVVGVLQGLFSVFGLFVCRSEHLVQEDQPHRKEGPGWAIIIGFTLVFLATYPLHMYISEVYLADDQSSFFFLLLKYCVGFLYLIFIPIITLSIQTELRVGIATVFGSAVMCLQPETSTDIEEQHTNGETTNLNNGTPRPNRRTLGHQRGSLAIEEEPE